MKTTDKDLRLQKTLQQLEGLLKYSPGFITIIDRGYRYIRVSGSVCRFMGLAEEKILGRTFDELLPPEIAANFRRRINGVLEKKASQEVEDKVQINGQTLYFSTTLFPIFDAAGEIEAVCGIATDISERKKVEDKLEQYRLAVESSRDLIAAVGQNYTYLLVNKPFLRYHGLNREMVIGRPISEILGEDLFFQVKPNLDRCFAGEFLYFEMPRDFPTIGMRDLQIQYFPMKENSGRIIGVVSVLRDITEQKLAEDALKISEERFRAIFETNPIGIGMISIADLRIRQANERFCGITGYSREEILQMNLKQITHPEDIEADIAGIRDLAQGKIPLYFTEKRYIRKDGDIRWISLTATLLPKNYGGLQMVIGMIEDITERKHWQEMLQGARAGAETANSAKSEFLANMSHELRTPLNAILGYAQLMRDDEGLTDQHRNAVEIMYRSGEHLLMLISDILDLSKIEAGKVELAAEDIHLSSFLNSISEMIRYRARERGLLFESCIQKNIPEMVSVDPKRLRQILLNLLSNAVKYTLKGSVVFEAYGEGEKICFKVADTGVGIPQVQIEQIFQPFHQIRDRRIHAEGTGLGLSISQKLVAMMGGNLEVESLEDAGSTFWFCLDLPNVERKMAPAAPPSLQRIIGYEGERIKVMIVDDQMFNRGLLRRLMEPLGFEVIEAEDGHDALIKDDLFSPDLILMDLIMPGMDGRDATRQIRQNRGKTPVIIGVSADVSEETIAETIEAGCDDFSVKPINIRDLLEKVGRYLGLCWIYEKRKGKAHKEGAEESCMIPPSKEDMDALHALAMIGDISGISAYVRKLESGSLEWQPFVRTLRKYAQGCQIKKIKALVSRYRR